jgi:hypothetical protein
VNYRLKLLIIIKKIYLIFYILLLELILLNAKLARILKLKKKKNGQEYKIKKNLEYKRINRKS